MSIGVVVIGRNEGERLRKCLTSVQRVADRVVYVDSGSTDGSVAMARGMGLEVVELDLSTSFTAARPRNEGFKKLLELVPNYVSACVQQGGRSGGSTRKWRCMTPR